jgi:hypothetical protein
MIFHVDPHLERYGSTEVELGGSMRVRGGIVHSSTPGSSQGGHGSHTRYDYPVAFEHYYGLTCCAKAYAALVGYLNYHTWHQFLNPDLRIGYGSNTECCRMTWRHVQDTAQLKHANPIGMLGLLDEPQLVGTSMELTGIGRPASGKLKLSVTPLERPTQWLSFDRPVEIHSGEEVLWRGPAARVVLHADGPVTLNVAAL